jgi:mRNA interferase MazF
MTSTVSFSKGEVILVQYPFTDLSNAKARPVAVVSAPHSSRDVFVVPLTTRITDLLSGEFVLSEREAAGLLRSSAVKRGIGTIHSSILIRRLGHLAPVDAERLDRSLCAWLAL